MPFIIGIAGTHSTGKSTFVERTASAIRKAGLRVGTIADLATKARSLGFPILTEHTYASTLWIIADGIRQEMEASLTSDVIIVDRPVPDALGYLLAALELTGREEAAERLDELHAMVTAHVVRYDHLIVTVLDEDIPLGEARDTNAEFRKSAARNVAALVLRHRPGATRMTSQNSEEVVAESVSLALSRFGTRPGDVGFR